MIVSQSFYVEITSSQKFGVVTMDLNKTDEWFGEVGWGEKQQIYI